MIGIFDTGVGGLTVVKQVFRYLPGYQIIYLGDTGRFPYTPKPLPTKVAFSIQDAEFLIAQGAKVLLIACNTITAFAGEEIKKRCSCPVFDIVTAGAIEGTNISKNNKIGVIGSRDTINSKIYENAIKMINPSTKLIQLATQLFIYLVEEDYIDYPETYEIVKNTLRPIKKSDVDTLILGCTHFPFLIDHVKSAMGESILVIDPAIELARQVKTFLENNWKVKESLTLGNNHRYFVSGDVPQFCESAKKILGREIENVSIVNWE